MEIASSRTLYELIAEDPPPDLVGFLLGEGVAAGRELMRPLERHRRLADAVSLPDEEWWHLWELYGLSRLCDFLLLPFQIGEPCAAGVDRIANVVFVRNDAIGREVRGPLAPPPEITIDTYVRFWEGLGFEPFFERPYSPFHHEIVAVDATAPAGTPITVAQVLWPGLTFGKMLFSRAGVCLRCPPGVLDTGSCRVLYALLRAPTSTPPDGGIVGRVGPQLAMADGLRPLLRGRRPFHFNVDGQDRPRRRRTGVGRNRRKSRQRPAVGGAPTNMLVHRCFVACRLPGIDRWPYYDTLTAASNQPCWPI